MIRRIVKVPSPILREKCQPVSSYTAAQGIIRDLWDTMYANRGVGLAAPQIGLSLAVCVCDPDWNGKGGPSENRFALVNPFVEGKWGGSVGEETCLSIPGKRYLIDRPTRIRVRSLSADSDGEAPYYIHDIGAFWARVALHEIDHLQGILISDHGSERK